MEYTTPTPQKPRKPRMKKTIRKPKLRPAMQDKGWSKSDIDQTYTK